MTRKEAYRARRAAGRCVGCSQSVVGRAKCASCQGKATGNTRAWRHAQKAKGNCAVCGKPAINGYYCRECQDKHNDKRYIRRGCRSERIADRRERYNRVTIARMQYELGEYWLEAEPWVREHLDVFNEVPDQVLFVARPLMQGEDFVDESASS